MIPLMKSTFLNEHFAKEALITFNYAAILRKRRKRKKERRELCRLS